MDTITKTAQVSRENSKVEFLQLGPLGLANHACPHHSTIKLFRDDRGRPTDPRRGLSESAEYRPKCPVKLSHKSGWREGTLPQTRPRRSVGLGSVECGGGAGVREAAFSLEDAV